MSFEQALLAEVRPYMFAAKARAILEQEVTKGCLPDIAPQPVALEPSFSPIHGVRDFLALESRLPEPQFVVEKPVALEDVTWLQVWISKEQELDWHRSERFVKQLQHVSYRVGFEITGNAEAVTIVLFCHDDDVPVVSAAFCGEFEKGELARLDGPPLGQIPGDRWEELLFLDYCVPPPYSHLLTRPEEMRHTPLEPLFAVMRGISKPAVAVYQAVFQPVHPEHDWHRNVEVLLDLEYAIKLHAGLQLPQRYAQQAPSGDLKQMAGEVVTKAHPDKPFYAAAFRVAVIGAGPAGHALLRALSTFTGLFQHQGRPLQCVTEAHYASVPSQAERRNMFLLGLTHRPGFLVNSWELTGPVHIPPAAALEAHHVPVQMLNTLPVEPGTLTTGTSIGRCSRAGMSQEVCIPDALRNRHTHLIGANGTGKTTTLEHMILQDIQRGAGVVVLDPHGDLVERLLSLVPDKHADRTIYFNPGDPDWVPLWNPLQKTPGQDTGRTADDLVAAVKSVVTGWGDRLEHLLRHAFYALLQRPGSTLLDAANLLRGKSEQSKRLRNELLGVVEGELARRFWQEDFVKYRGEDITAVQHKLSKLLVSGTVSLMLSQPESRFQFREMMDSRMVFLANLSSIGSETRETLGSLMLSLLHVAALSRSDTPTDQRAMFHIYCDEAHRFMTYALEDLLTETRKFGVSLTVAHQYMSQFGQRRTDALSSVGSTVVFKVDAKDARYLTKDFMEKIVPEDLTDLERGEAIARVGTDVVRIETPEPKPIPARNCREGIIEKSRQQCCCRVAEVRRTICRGSGAYWGPAQVGSGQDPERDTEELTYDEF